MQAQDFLLAGIGHMQNRASTYDKPEGERSMAATVAAFNAVTGDGLMNTEERGWLFMQLLKAVRSQQGDFRADSHEEDASYTGLAGEAAYKARRSAPAEGNWPESAEARSRQIMQNGNDGAPYESFIKSSVVMYKGDDCDDFDEFVGGLSYLVDKVATHEMISNGVVTQQVGDVFIINESGQPARFSAEDARKQFCLVSLTRDNG